MEEFDIDLINMFRAAPARQMSPDVRKMFLDFDTATCNRGDLRTLMARVASLPPADVSSFVRVVCDALAHTHPPSCRDDAILRCPLDAE